jgi:predicted  nucleic acid-binding Zn-ribbon protein
MASRTSAGTGMIITVAMLAIFAVGFLITSVVFYSQKSKAEGAVLNLTNTYEEIIATGERQSNNVEVALNAARAERKSLVDYLLSNNNELTRIATGSGTLTIEQVRERADTLTDGTGSLAARIQQLEGDVASIASERDSTQERLDRQQADLQAELENLQTIEASADAKANEAIGRVDGYRREVANLRSDVEGFEQRTSQAAFRDRDEYNANLRERDGRIAELNQQILVLRDQVRRLRGESDTDRVTPFDEYALVDGEVAAVQPGDNLVIITLGRADKLVIGMLFSVYSDASSIRPTASGEYLPGKAVIEVIGMDESSARCRVIRASRGNPVVVGDVIANPVYDPKKTYNFVVFGNFDVDGDGVATPFERDALVAVIERWGGKVIDDISGDLDFLVLGKRPNEPLQPAPNAPRVVYDEYLRLKNRVTRYEELFEAASASSIPVLNENRLRTLIGEFPR